MCVERVERRFEGLGGGEDLTDVAVGDAFDQQRAGMDGGRAGTVDEAQRLVGELERGLVVAAADGCLRAPAQEARALLGLEIEPQRLIADPTQLGPVGPLQRGLGGEIQELEPLLQREWFVAEEVIEALAETAGDELQRTDRRPNAAALQLADETLGQLLAGELSLTHPALLARRSNSCAESVRGTRPAGTSGHGPPHYS